MKLTEQLLKVLEAVCDSEAEYQKQQELVINNTIKLERKQDEVTYLMHIAKEHIQVFSHKGEALHLCYDLIQHLVSDQAVY